MGVEGEATSAAARRGDAIGECVPALRGEREQRGDSVQRVLHQGRASTGERSGDAGREVVVSLRDQQLAIQRLHPRRRHRLR